MMFRGKKWKLYAKKKTVEEINRMRVQRARNGWRSRRAKKLLRKYPEAENSHEARRLENMKRKIPLRSKSCQL